MLMQQETKEPLPQTIQAPPPVRSRSKSSKVTLALLGVALPLIAGSMVWWPWGVPDVFDNGWVLGAVALAMGLSVIIGAGLLYLAFRTWWASLMAPLAWLVAEFAGAVIRPLVEGGWTALQAEEHFWDGVLTIFGIAAWPLLFCLAVGIIAGLGLDTWMNRRAARRPIQ